MPCQYSDEAEGEAAEEIDGHVEVLTVLHQRRTFIHKGGEGGETSAEACGEQELRGGRHEVVAIPVKSRQKTDDEASQYIYRQGTEGEGDECAGLYHLRHPVSQSASKKAANAD